MKKLNIVLALAWALALGLVASAGAVENPRGLVWTVGDASVQVLKSGALTQSKPPEYTADTSQSAVEASTAILNTASYQIVTSSGGVVTLTSTPSVSTTTAEGIALATGKVAILRGTSDANAVVIQDDDTLASSQVELGASSRSLGLNDILVLLWDASTSTTGRWLEVSFSNLD